MSHQISTYLGITPYKLQAQYEEIFSVVGKGNSTSGISCMAIESIILEEFNNFQLRRNNKRTYGNIAHWYQVIAFLMIII